MTRRAPVLRAAVSKFKRSDGPDVDVRIDAGARRKQQLEVLRQDADDLGAANAEPDGLADDRRIAADIGAATTGD